MRNGYRFFMAVLGVLLLTAFPLTAQTVYPVYAGDGTLQTAIDAAADGDILELMDSGGLYTNSASDNMEITKKLTIRAMEGLAEKPVIRITKLDASSARLFEIAKGGSLNLQGLDLDGRAEDGGASFAKNILRSPYGVLEADSFHFNLKVEDCILHNTTEAIFKGYSNTMPDTVIFTNCIFDEAYNEGIVLRESTSAGGPKVKYVDLNNCTFTKIGREAFYLEFSNPVICINHCTFDSVSYRENKRVIYPVGVTDMQITNSIFSNQLGTKGESIALYGNSSISYCDTFNVDEVVLKDAATIGDGMLGVDPMYTDPENNDYTLDLNSPVIGMANDGNAMGDLRWDPTILLPKVIQVKAGDGTLQAALDGAKAGDIIELVTSGGYYDQSGTSSIKVYNPVTIRAREGLAQRPILRNLSPTAGTPIVLEIKKGGSVILQGVELDGRWPDGSVHATYLIRTASGVSDVDAYEFDLKAEDCYFHDVNQNFAKFYYNTTVDTLMLNNCLFERAGREGLLMRETTDKAPVMNYVEITNCSFFKTAREAYYSQYNDPVIRINHCTFDSVGYEGSDRMLYPNGVNDVQIKNSIFTNEGGYSESIKLYGNSTISYSDTFNIAPVKLDGSASIGTGMLGVDPLYNHPETGDYRLANDSPVRGAADDGSAMGDLRWEASPDQYYLTITTKGSGIVQMDPPGGVYDPGTSVEVTAIADPGWEFDSWEGNVFPPDANPVTILMNSNQTLKATFKSLTPQVTLTVDTLGLGHVDVDPQPIDGTYDIGTDVTLTAVPQENWVFVEWQGDVSGTDNPVTTKLDSNMHVTASFASIFTQYSLNIETVGMGSVTMSPEPILGTYDSSAVVSLTAQPVPGWEFAGWTGDLESVDNPDTVVMNSDKNITATFSEIQFAGHTLEVDTTWDMRDAIEFANNNSNIDTVMLVTSGGLYTSRSTSTVSVMKPLVVLAKPGLETKPVVTNSDPNASVLDIFRVFNDFTLKGVVLDGGNEISHGMKYGVRLSNSSSDTVKWGSNITLMDVDFKDMFALKDPKADGHAFKIDVDVVAGTVRIENCTFTSLGYEAIRISDTEKFSTDRALDSLIVKNCTFTDIDAECIRYYSDAVLETPDAPVIIEHLTVNNSATRVIYLKNSAGAIVRDLIISNSRLSGHGRDGDIMDAQGEGSTVSHIDTFNVANVELKASKGGEIDSTTIYGFDPLYEDASQMNYTLLPASPAYGKSYSGNALGDLRWADPTVGITDPGNVEVPMVYRLDQNYPNPFNPSTTINFSLMQPGKTTLKIYNILGKEVATLVNGYMQAGAHRVVFNARSLATGVYFYKISSGKFTAVKKMLLVK